MIQQSSQTRGLVGHDSRHLCPGMVQLCRERDDLIIQCDRLEQDRIQISAEAGRYRSWHEMAKQREESLIRQVNALDAENKRLKRDLYARKSEASPKKEHGGKPASKRRRGQQPGNAAPDRRTHPDLVMVPEIVDLPQDAQQCPACSQGLEALPFDDTTIVLEIHVQGYVRKITKKCYRPTCTCGVLPGIVSQPAVGSLFPGSRLGVTMATELLMAKFRSGQPIYRLLQHWRGLGIDLALGTVYGLQRPLKTLFEPIYNEIAQRSRAADHWHIDETRWMVLVEIPGKTNNNWWMWVFVTTDTIFFILSPTRSAAVITGHLGHQPQGIASVDRFSAYKAVSVRALQFLLAFCWAHARRDFTTIAATVTACAGHAMEWVDRIGRIYAANAPRIAQLDHPRSAAYQTADQDVRRQVEQFERRVDSELARENLHPVMHKAIERLSTHMEGLKIFVDHPEIPMDNNCAENALRPQVIIRKNSFFNGSRSTAKFHVIMTSVIATLERNGINPRTWMMDYLQECALAGGKPPPDVKRFLPWNATVKDRQRWSGPDPARPWPRDVTVDDRVR